MPTVIGLFSGSYEADEDKRQMNVGGRERHSSWRQGRVQYEDLVDYHKYVDFESLHKTSTYLRDLKIM